MLVLADREFLWVPLWRALSFTDTLRAARRSVTAAPGVFSP
ncbi:hypothetical protein [Streptomyces sp. NPDC053720]